MDLREDQDILLALDTLSSASPETLIRLRKQVTKAMDNVRKKLASQADLSSVALLDGLLKSLLKIRECFKEPAIQRRWTSEDPRITDIRRTTKGATDEERILSFLAERSLALEKVAWELKNGRTPQVDRFAHDLTSAGNKRGPNGNIEEFLRYKGLSGEPIIHEGIRRGQKCLVWEKLYHAHRGATAAFAFRPEIFRRLPYTSLPVLYGHLGQATYRGILVLAEELSVPLDRCQAFYDSGTDNIIALLRAGPRYGLPMHSSAASMPSIGIGRDGTNVRIEEITAEEQSRQEEDIRRRRLEPLPTGQTGTKRPRLNVATSNQRSAPSQCGSIHRSQDAEIRTGIHGGPHGDSDGLRRASVRTLVEDASEVGNPFDGQHPDYSTRTPARHDHRIRTSNPAHASLNVNDARAFSAGEPSVAGRELWADSQLEQSYAGCVTAAGESSGQATNSGRTSSLSESMYRSLSMQGQAQSDDISVLIGDGQVLSHNVSLFQRLPVHQQNFSTGLVGAVDICATPYPNPVNTAGDDVTRLASHGISRSRDPPTQRAYPAYSSPQNVSLSRGLPVHQPLVHQPAYTAIPDLRGAMETSTLYPNPQGTTENEVTQAEPHIFPF